MGQEPPPTSVSAARPVCEPVDKIPQLLYSNPTRYLEILLPNATSGGRGLLPQEADDTSRYVEADGKETTASPLLPPGRVARRGKAARGEGRPCTTKLINRYEHEGGPSVTGSSHATAKSSLSAMCHRRFDAR